MSDNGELADGTWGTVALNRVIELRIHGVGGTPPADMLDDPNPVQVSGDRTAGVMRTSHGKPIEAYSWGGLTGRSQVRALWLLVLPFAMINLAGWMTASRDRVLHRALVQLAGLAMTALYVLFTAAITMDFLAYQCAGAPGCAAASWPLIGAGGFADTPARRAVIGAVGPLLVIGLLAALTRTSRHRYEQWAQAGPPPRNGRADDLGLSDENFWNGQAFAAGLARVHYLAGFALVALLLSATAASTTDSAVAPGLTIGVAAVLVIASGLALFRRVRARIPHKVPQIVGGVLVVAAAVVAWVGTPEGTAPKPLPGILPTFAGVLLVLYLSVLGLLLGRGDTDRQRSWRGRLRERMTPFAVSVHAAMLAPAFLAGTALSVARWLGTTASVGQPGYELAEILYPQPYELLARSLVVLIVAAVLIALVATAIVWRAGGDDALTRLKDAWPGSADPTPPPSAQCDGHWMKKVRTALRIPRASLTAVEWTVWTLAVLIAAGFLVYGGSWAIAWLGASDKNSPLAIDTGGLPLPPLGFSVWTLTLLPLVLLAVLRQGLRNPSARRRIAIAWDVATFWPRGYHPLCPPSYAERAVPEIRTRLRRIWAAHGSVVLMAHSQGCVLAIAAVAGLRPDEDPERLSVVSYGNPIRRLYARHFPGYVNEELLGSVRAKASGWCNFHRDTDFVGHRMFVDGAGQAGGAGREVYLPDPATDRYLLGDQLPEIRGHAEKGYRRQSQFVAHVDTTTRSLELITPAQPSTAQQSSCR